VKVINDTARFVSKVTSATTPGVYTPDNLAGAEFAYDFASVKDSILPDRGVTFSVLARHTQNMDVSDKSFQLYSGNVQFFIPLIPKISLAIKTGASTISGTPLFYQYPSIGQSYNLRGFRRERFSGKSTAYNNVELRFISKFRSYLFNGKAGLMAFMDNGRVWLPGEDSDKIHTTYGGGVLIAPFNMVSAAITYGVSDEIKMLQFRLGILF
jgi:hemolysin activation/secretion protein